MTTWEPSEKRTLTFDSLTRKRLQWIGESDYKTLLGYWYYAPYMEPMLNGELRVYYEKELAYKKSLLSNEEVNTIIETLSIALNPHMYHSVAVESLPVTLYLKR